jgi:purine-binding chemotaxis protein CheW
MENETIHLPASGLAEDILGSFVREEQKKVDETQEESGKVEAGKTYHLVTFFLGREEYGVEIGSVQEIIRAADIRPVPGAPPHVKGVINLRGKIIPVADLRTRFGLPAGEESEQQRIVVVEIGERRVGMLVDSVSQVLKIPAAVIEDLPEEARSLDDSYILGVGKLDDRLIVILDLRLSLLMKF